MYINVMETELDKIFDKDLISIEELCNKLKDTLIELDALKEKNEDLEYQIEDLKYDIEHLEEIIKEKSESLDYYKEEAHKDELRSMGVIC